MSRHKQEVGFWNVRVPVSDYDRFCHAAKQSADGLHKFVADTVREYREAGSPALPQSTEPLKKFYGALFLPLDLAMQIGGEFGKRSLILERAIRFKAQSLPEIVHPIKVQHTPNIDLAALAAKVFGRRNSNADRANQPTA